MKGIFDKCHTSKGIRNALDCIFLCHYHASNAIFPTQKCNAPPVASKAGYLGDDYPYYDDLFRGTAALQNTTAIERASQRKDALSLKVPLQTNTIDVMDCVCVCVCVWYGFVHN